MSRAKIARANLSELVDSDSEDGLGGNNFSIAKPAVATKTAKRIPAMPPKKAAAKGAAARQTANKVTKPAPAKSTTRGNNARAAAALEAVAEEESRIALAEKPTNAQPKATGRGRKKAAPAPEPEQEDTVMEDATEEPVTKSKGARGRPKKTVDEPSVKEAPAPKGRAGRKKAQPIEEEAEEEPEEEPTEIPETQQPGAQAEAEVEEMEEDQTEFQVPGSFPETSEPTRPVSLSSPSKRPSYSSDSGGEPALRRRLGEMTQKYESLEAKYRDLKEVAVREAERNFDRLKKQTDDKAKTADQLIASLKAELASQKEEAKEAAVLRKQLEASEARADDLQTRVAALTKSLTESKTEIKSLNMKLTAARSAEASAVASIKVPNSAIKGGHSAAIKGAVASSHQATLSAQMKEDLYADLTGLIMRSAKRENGEDVYDCIQTGRNGTLHFKLEIPNDASGENFEDAQFRYTPKLDPSRDRPLIEILPDFLVEEITFPRPHAIKFYARVMKALAEAPPPPESPE